MQPLDEHVFAPVESFILLCIAFESVYFPFSISAHSSFNHSSFASLHFFLISRCNCLYSSLFFCGIACLLRIILSISSVIHLFLDCFVFFGMVYFAVSTRASLNTSHVVLLPSCSKTENLFFTSIAYYVFDVLVVLQLAVIQLLFSFDHFQFLQSDLQFAYHR